MAQDSSTFKVSRANGSPLKGKRVLAAAHLDLRPDAGAGNGIRTRDTKLGKLVLYQLSYARLEL
jgi:hypothetical protein